MRIFRDSMQNNLSLCQYNVRPFTHAELDALEEYDDKLTLLAHFDLETLLEQTTDPAAAMRERAEELTRWHQAFTDLLVDPRLRNMNYDDSATSIRLTPTADSDSPYSPAVRRFLKAAAADYHRHRHGFEYAVTVWALQLQVPESYPPESRHLDLDRRALKLWE
ncbi:hypothetical protein ABZ383_33745 [Streptomyces sp. NPDC005900]|uniref:hypothetical protein n=1 Tax=Streptomyces sp. NPDC005900 TaxID=3154569 RepID=UPI0033FE4BB6